jgi:MbtH protein
LPFAKQKVETELKLKMSAEVAKPNKVIHSSGQDDEEDNADYNVVTDIEERYSIWPKDSKIPMYWKAEGFSGKKKDCLDYIQRVWTDMRPLSLRLEMERRREELEKRKPSEEQLKKLQEEREKAMAEGIDHFHSKLLN